MQVELKETKGAMVEMWRRYELAREAGLSRGEERVMERAGGRGESDGESRRKRREGE